ncbi:RagB/SusD family nutrient uptake outer membrane protein [Parapedobacter tibetensis]|uniref:RagB/SusD family nutrient uptake outer membrane protein n=1 Tax=Parapedobacter tibetensis TaxID=2972951 RepID=UPI00214D3667|nr:RagB/SusD family nutrient uptake outer membrane protein [Parapedobacter tibetensis]
MKKIIFPIMAIIGFAACSKYLDREPIGLINEDVINTQPSVNTVTSAVNSAYVPLSSTLNILGEWDWNNGLVIRNDFIIQDITSGDINKKWNPDGDQAWMDDIGNFNFTADNGGFNGVWSYAYEGISRANGAINQLENSELMLQIGMSESRRNRFLGETYFVRAFNYFDLVTNFGDVPLLLKPLNSFEEAYEVAKREPKEMVWQQIRTDLGQALSLLPDGKFSDNTDKWRASKGAVLAMQAKVALYNSQWQEVVDKVNALETLGYYDLNANYFDSFDVTKEFADDEVIFAYDHQSSRTPARGSGLTAIQNWGFVAPTQNFMNAFEASDPRLAYTVDPVAQNVYKLLGATTAIYKGNEDSPVNRIYIRWADVLLWKAEAHNELGQYTAAITLINDVRERARTTPTINGAAVPAGTLPARNTGSTNKEEVKGWLMHERRVELGVESHRFNDLRRWGTAKDVLTALGKNFQDRNYLYPIPQGEVDKSAGTISQNPGY